MVRLLLKGLVLLLTVSKLDAWVVVSHLSAFRKQPPSSLTLFLNHLLESMEQQPQYLQLSDYTASLLAFHHHKGKSPGLLFLPGFHSNMNGQKALALENWCKSEGRQFTRFDYSGHGQSSGQIEDGSVGVWLRDALQILDQVTSGPQVLVGSSMGGWIMVLVAISRPERIRALVGIAAAPDFTERIRFERLDSLQLQQLNDTGFCDMPNSYDDGAPYRISRHLLEEAANHLLLDQSEIPVDVPVRLIHGQADEEIPWQDSLSLAQKLRTDNVELQLVKSGNHRLSEPQDLDRLVRTTEQLLTEIDDA